MSGTPDRTPILAVKCSNCGRENAAGRVFCQFCGYRIPARPQAPQDVPELKGQLAPPVEPPPPPAPLPAVPNENQNLRQQLESMQEELNRAKTVSAKLEASLGGVAELRTKLKSAEDKAATLESQSAEWEKKWKSSEEKAASFEKQMAAKVNEVAALQRNPDAKSNQRSKLIAGTLVMFGILGGYGAGRFAQPKDDPKGRVNELLTQVTNAQEQINNLKASLDAANKKADQVANDSKKELDSANAKISDLTKASTAGDGHQQLIKKLQRDLASTAAQLTEANGKEHAAEELMAQRLAQQQAASNQRVQQLQTELQMRDNEISTLRGRSAKSPTPRADPQQCPSPSASDHAGCLIWSGTVVGNHRVNIVNIKDGGVTSSAADYGNVKSGALPGTPCTVATPDPAHVHFKTRPERKNQWSRVSFEVSGTGAVQVRINWVSSQ